MMTKAEQFTFESEPHIYRARDQLLAVRALLSKGIEGADEATLAAFRFADDAFDELTDLVELLKAA